MLVVMVMKKATAMISLSRMVMLFWIYKIISLENQENLDLWLMRYSSFLVILRI